MYSGIPYILKTETREKKYFGEQTSTKQVILPHIVTYTYSLYLYL